MKLTCKKIAILFLLCWTQIPIYGQEGNELLLSKSQITALYNEIISEIEYLDTEAIPVRNTTKKVSWEAYKKYHHRKFETVKTTSELKKRFEDFGKGFVSGHSDFEFLLATVEIPKTKLKSNIEIGYTYPNISFFDLKTRKTISKINGMAIDSIFSDFVDFRTTENGINDCQKRFKSRFENSELLVEGRPPNSITFESHEEIKLVYTSNQNTASFYEELVEGIDISPYAGWEVIETGYKSALLKKDKVALLKTKDFMYFKGRGGNIKCDSVAADSTMCNDVRRLRKGMVSIEKDIEYMIFDMQGNRGGIENTPFLMEFCPNPFYDLRVQYRKTSLLSNDKLRPQLFYDSERAENWFNEISSNGVLEKAKDGDFLPPRADFCQGAENCDFSPIAPNKSALNRKYNKIILLVNEATASSGDDFTFRMKEYGGALVVGQPHSADLTYALVTVLFYLDDERKIQKKYLGNRQSKYEINGTEILKFSIPYSRTVDKNGNLLQGNPVQLDMEVELTKENFEIRELDVLNSVVDKLITNR